MIAGNWQPEWVRDHVSPLAMHAYRLVETQHIAATMRLLDSVAEQDLLEQMLETSKPPMPEQGEGLHYLLAAPFRYLPQTPSRFRAVNMPGIWYGADSPMCACAEIAYWRQRFLLDSVGLVKQDLMSEHSMYEADIDGMAIDLTAPPWVQDEALWRHHSDYTHTNRLGKLVREDGTASWIRYASVRSPGSLCAAVFDPRILTMATPEFSYEQWHCYVTHDRVTMSNGRERFDF